MNRRHRRADASVGWHRYALIPSSAGALSDALRNRMVPLGECRGSLHNVAATGRLAGVPAPVPISWPPLRLAWIERSSSYRSVSFFPLVLPLCVNPPRWEGERWR
jgi:hypothetical protein